MTFYKLQIKDMRTETADCVSVSFHIPEDLKTTFTFQAGQYLTLRTFIEGEDVRRSYSLCSSPLDNEWRVAIKKVESGVFSTFGHTQLKKGDWLDVMPPMGHFTLPKMLDVETLHCNVSTPARYVFFAAGSGITPILSILKTVLKSDPKSHCTLIYGNRNATSVIFREHIEGLKNKYLNRFQIFHVLSRERVDSELGSGRLDKAKLAYFIQKMPDILLQRSPDGKGGNFYICGPYDMIQDIKSVLLEHEISPKNIHFELFNAPNKSRAIEKKAIDLSKTHIVTIKLDGLTFDVPTPEGMNILDAAQSVGADLPYACKGGVCCTCRAKLLEGNVEMEVNYALTEEETAAGFILTCQAVPKSERLVVSFDVK